MKTPMKVGKYLDDFKISLSFAPRAFVFEYQAWTIRIIESQDDWKTWHVCSGTKPSWKQMTTRGIGLSFQPRSFWLKSRSTKLRVYQSPNLLEHYRTLSWRVTSRRDHVREVTLRSESSRQLAIRLELEWRAVGWRTPLYLVFKWA